MPGNTMELNAYWNESPQKYSPGAASTTPRYSIVQPWPPTVHPGHPALVSDHAAPVQIALLDPEGRPAMEAHFVHLLAAHRSSPGQHVPEHEHGDRKEHPGLPGLRAEGDGATTRATEGRRPRFGEFVRDVQP